MFKLTNLFIKTFSVMNIFMIILAHLFEVADSEASGVSFRIYDETLISSQGLEGYSGEGPSLEYPKVAILEDEHPIVIFLDLISEKVTFAEIYEGSVKNINSFPNISKHWWSKWPAIFVKKNEIFLANDIDNKPSKKGQHRIKVFVLNRNDNQLTLKKDRKFTIKGRYDYLSGIYPYGDKYVVLGVASDVRFHVLGLLSGHFPSFKKNFSFILDDDETVEPQSIEKEGAFGTKNREYIVSDSGIIHAAWIRTNIGRIGFTPKHDEVVCYSEYRNGKTWETPLNLYSLKETEKVDQLRNLSLAAYENSAFLLWHDIEKGYYFSEIKNGSNYDVKQINDVKRPLENQNYIEPLPDAATAKITADYKGNIYALWVINTLKRYQIFLKARIDGIWADDIVINSGLGIVKLPDMKVDKRESIHIAYIKQASPQDKFACYYMKVEKSEKK